MIGWSLPARGAWVEMGSMDPGNRPSLSLPARGAWVEIETPHRMAILLMRRSPHGERGLKSCLQEAETITGLVAPRTGSVG